MSETDDLGNENVCEEEVESKSVIDKALKRYRKAAPNNIREIQQSLQFLLTPDALACLLCLKSVTKHSNIWTCRRCFCILDLSCVVEWSLKFKTSDSIDSTVIKWFCPKCECEYKDLSTLSAYFCFCGKVENPALDPWLIPHSCGKICSKLLKPFCGHYCSIRCHPGPCPPCPKPLMTTCTCAKSDPLKVMCSKKDWNCKRLCKKILSCNKHYCNNRCHDGYCKPCTVPTNVSCVCGSSRTVKQCFKSTWHCSKVCGKRLNCDKHYCILKCHKDDCPPCTLYKPRPCPCNGTLRQVPCTHSIVPPCGNICGKLLLCGKHKCQKKCHLGPCDFCNEKVMMKCRCGKVEKLIQCRKEFFCENRCQDKRNCGKHNCNQKCCIEHRTCVTPCLKTLNCGIHQCQRVCHDGPCFPCQNIVNEKCICGSAKIQLLCGQKKYNMACSEDCVLPSDCHHTKRQRHNCHLGKCPPCRRICDKRLPCNHSCKSKCHTIKAKETDENNVQHSNDDSPKQLIDKPCPPCISTVSSYCVGKHTLKNFKCSEIKHWTCDNKCGRKLKCMKHTCELPCHEVDCSYYEDDDNEHCAPCPRPCENKRPQGCVHECKSNCHVADCMNCLEIVKVRCFCEQKKVFMQCYKWTDDIEYDKLILLSCHKKCPNKLNCGHRCPLKCHVQDCPDKSECWKKVQMMCPCKNIQIYVPCHEEREALKCDETCFARKQTIRNGNIVKDQGVEPDCLDSLNVDSLDTSNADFLETSNADYPNSLNVDNLDFLETSNADCPNNSNVDCLDSLNTDCWDSLNADCLDSLNTNCLDTSNEYCLDSLSTDCLDTSNADCLDSLNADCLDTLNTECLDTSNADCLDTSNANCSNSSKSDCSNSSNADCLDSSNADCAESLFSSNDRQREKNVPNSLQKYLFLVLASAVSLIVFFTQVVLPCPKSFNVSLLH